MEQEKSGKRQTIKIGRIVADEEKVRLTDTVEIRDAGAMGEALFALRDLEPRELQH